MATLTQASRNWASRPMDERFVSLYDMQDHFHRIRGECSERIVDSRAIEAVPDADNKGLWIAGPAGHQYAPSHWSFGQLAQLADAPAGYLRRLPAPLAADLINYGLKISRDVEDVGLLLQRNGSNLLRAATGAKYGRIWNADIVDGLTKVFGDGVTGFWKVPGEFGQDVKVTKENTTLYAGDRDMFVFLADETNRIEIPNRRDGQTGSLARGFFVWNSEVGSSTFGVSTFLFDYVCSNRIVWGATEVKEIKLRHTKSAPVRFLEQVAPALHSYASSSSRNIIEGIANARKARIDDVEEFLAKRFTKNLASVIMKTHELEEGRPVETLWDAATGLTAHAKTVGWQDERVALERKAGELLRLPQ